MAPRYIENNIDGQILHQAIYSSVPPQYLSFIKLYELVSQWKSCYVMINGTVVDRKIVQGLNYCYGDKCRSGKFDFCYGASYMTENIFGCHRLQISSCNHPLHQFYHIGKFGLYYLDKELLLKRISEKSTPYLQCPAFDFEHILKIANALPNMITIGQYKKMANNNFNSIGILLKSIK